MEKKRSSRIIMTNEARVLKEMRYQKGLSLRKAGDLIGKSDTYIAHIEGGRMDVPIGHKLQVLLDLYGPIKIKSFYERARLFRAKITKKDELLEIIQKISDEKVEILLGLAKSLTN